MIVLLSAAMARADATVPGDEAAAWKLAKSNPQALVREAIQNELQNSYGHHPPVRYLFRKLTLKSDTTKEIVETSDGGVARLVAIRNQPLNVEQNEAETNRLQALGGNPSAEEHRRRSEQRDAEKIAGIMQLLPDAYLNQYAGPVQTPAGTAIRLIFTPNPRFSPPTLESKILIGIRGEIWIDPKDLRVVHIEGHLFRTVEYGWGILGTLYPGGTILIEQARTTECGWQLAHLKLNMEGKALMLKPLRVVVEETASYYHPVPKNWTYRDAIRWLLAEEKLAPASGTQP